jgi:hypothetical protein
LSILTNNNFVGKLSAVIKKIGSGANYTSFEPDGTIVLNGSATVWNDAFVDGLSLVGGATDPPVFAAFMGTVFGRRFDDAKVSSAHGTLEVPHDYKEGTAIDVHIHWSPTTTNTGNCQWGFEYTIANINGTFGATTTPTPVVQAGSGVIAKHQMLDIAQISGTGRKISDVICFRIFRDGNALPDSFTGNAFLHRIALHYECDTLGSRQETIK